GDVGGMLDEGHEAPLAAFERLLCATGEGRVAAQEKRGTAAQTACQDLDRHEAAVAPLKLHFEAKRLVSVLHLQQRQEWRAHGHEVFQGQPYEFATTGAQGDLGTRVAVDDAVVLVEDEDGLAGVLQQLFQETYGSARSAVGLGGPLGPENLGAHYPTPSSEG